MHYRQKRTKMVCLTWQKKRIRDLRLKRGLKREIYYIRSRFIIIIIRVICIPWYSACCIRIESSSNENSKHILLWHCHRIGSSLNYFLGNPPFLFSLLGKRKKKNLQTLVKIISQLRILCVLHNSPFFLNCGIFHFAMNNRS